MNEQDNAPIDYFDEPLEPVVSEPATLERLMTLAENARELALEIEKAEVALAELQGKHQKITQRQLPELMEALGMEKFKLKTGEEVSVKDDIKCGLTEEHKPKAWEWLESKGYDGIIKTVVNVPYGRGEVGKAKELISKLAAEFGVDADLSRSVHYQTLKSFVKERLEAGDLPSDMLAVFSVYEFKEAKIKAPAAKRR